MGGESFDSCCLISMIMLKSYVVITAVVLSLCKFTFWSIVR